MKTIQIALIVTFQFLIFNFHSTAQSVGINSTGASPDASAILDLNATDKGFLITRADTVNITSPAFGLITLAPIDSCLYLYNGIAWMGMGGGGSDCSCNCKSTVASFMCGNPFTDDRDSEEYGTVQIGKQCWMSENLNHKVSDSWCYNNDVNKCNTYGRLYEWNIAMDGSNSSNANPSGIQGICPTGWHLPSDEEWKELEMELGMSQSEADGTMYRGTNEGDKMKTSSWGGNNSSGFTALPGGYRFNGTYYVENHYGYWWTATDRGTDAWVRHLRNIQSDVYRFYNNKAVGRSVRCVKD